MTHSNTKSNEDYLKDFLNTTDQNKLAPNINYKETPREDKSLRASELDYFAFDAELLPLGKFYPRGTRILVRPAIVKEIQSYSMVEDKNPYDVIEKMNDMISACVRVKYSNEEVASYLELKDGDRFYLIFLIRELTFQAGNTLAAQETCDCGSIVSIDLRTKNFSYHETDEKIMKYYDESKRKFIFPTKLGKTYEMGMPCIGLQKSFSEYIIKEFKDKRSQNMAFLKIMPFLLSDRKNMTIEQIKQELDSFQSISLDQFQFLDSVASKFKFGISGAKTKCSCGMEVSTENIFPTGAAGIFSDIDEGFDRFIQ